MDHKHTGFSTESLRLIGAALALQHVEGKPAHVVPIPSTGRFVVIGTPAEVARLLDLGPAFANDGREPDWAAYGAAEAASTPATTPASAHPAAAALADVLRAELRAILVSIGTTGWSDTLPTDRDARAIESLVRRLITAPSRPIAPTVRAVCMMPPPGWYCTRDRGHDGPCAAHPAHVAHDLSEGGHHD